ncbi:MAG: lipopolysaccharide assembly protein LapB [Casimicrobiaceae bacterium]
MDFEFWWLLVPALFFAMGWLAARIDIKHVVHESRALPVSYFKGLNFLLNEQPDKAIEAFNDVVKVKPETVELHFALGSLFRRQGEVDRAIRLHQNLLERPDLPSENRVTALYEIGQDYQRAGLLDRAEEAYIKLEGTLYEHQALDRLLQIYEHEKDWLKAIAVTKKIEGLTRAPYFKEIAHYYCELGSAEMLQSRFGPALEYLDRALAEYKACVRATLLQGDVFAAQGRYQNAIGSWQRIESQNPAFLGLAADKLRDAYVKLDQSAQGLRLVSGYQATYPSPELLNVVFRLTLDTQGAEAAAALIRTEMQRNPTLLGLDRLLEAEMIGASESQRRDMEMVKGLVHQHTKRLGLYRCDNCGFRARQYYWRCPGCGRWESFPPRINEAPDNQ